MSAGGGVTIVNRWWDFLKSTKGGPCNLDSKVLVRLLQKQGKIENRSLQKNL